MHKFIVFALLTGCASSELGDSGSDIDRAEAATVDAPPAMPDASPAADATATTVRIHRLVWSWPSCAAASPTTPPLTLAVSVELSLDPSIVDIAGTASGCDSFAKPMASVTCYPTVPPTGRVLQVRASSGGGPPHDVKTPIEDCVNGELILPPDDDGDATQETP